MKKSLLLATLIAAAALAACGKKEEPAPAPAPVAAHGAHRPSVTHPLPRWVRWMDQFRRHHFEQANLRLIRL